MARITAARRKAETDLIEGVSADTRLVQGVVRGLAVLRAFRPGENPLSNAEIALRTGLPKPTVSRLTQTLTALGYLSFIPGLGRYALGPGVVALCHSLLAGMPHRIAALPVLQEMADYSRLPVSLGLRDQLDILYIETARHAEARPARFDLGARLPIEVSSVGRAYLYSLPESERAMVLARVRKERGGRNWAKVEARLQSSFEMIAKRGFCISAGEWRRDVIGVGAPVVTGDGSVFAINCGGTPFEISVDRIENDIGPRLAHAASQIAARNAI